MMKTIKNCLSDLVSFVLGIFYVACIIMALLAPMLLSGCAGALGIAGDAVSVMKNVAVP